ncbi:MAG: hypothetical protein K2W82_17340 [Candidatus Obscuribacterales bacterium]|nr:hypothetical protein [Candidatus Obscuribacterales bacterium]
MSQLITHPQQRNYLIWPLLDLEHKPDTAANPLAGCSSLDQIEILGSLHVSLHAVVEKAKSALERYNKAKGCLNEHQYEGKLLAARKESAEKLAKVIADQQRNRAWYEAARINLLLATRKLDSKYKMLNALLQLIKEMVSDTPEWHTIAFNALLLRSEFTSLRPRIANHLNEDLSEGQGREALRKTFAAACANEPTGFEFDLKNPESAVFYPVADIDYIKLHCIYECPQSIDRLRKAMLRLNGFPQSEEILFNLAKRHLNEPQYRQRLESLLQGDDQAQVETLTCQQAQLRYSYVSALLQGVHSWNFIDFHLERLRKFVADVQKQLDACKDDEELVAIVMIDQIAARAWIRSFETGREKFTQFRSLCSEPNAVTALTHVRELFMDLDTTLDLGSTPD